ncbi:MAG: hypothetical protein U9Q77_05120 [Candidatus Marinimicrobia bacterium]|nr:hypothetical protein [Candidatus Neomarinimicrobiota bacterium]
MISKVTLLSGTVQLMPFNAHKYKLIMLSSFLTVVVNLAGSDFPNWQDQSSFQTDLRAAARVTNIPNPGNTDYYLGLQASLASIRLDRDESATVPSARLSIYPNPGYNLWAQFAQWPGDYPAFSVATGVQVEFPADQRSIRQAIGLGWSEVIGKAYTQRDISVYALYGRSQETFNYGLMAIVDMHHVLVENGNGIPDYDKTNYLALPYISWLFLDQSRVSLYLPIDANGLALDLSCEWLLGSRE